MGLLYGVLCLVNRYTKCVVRFVEDLDCVSSMLPMILRLNSSYNDVCWFVCMKQPVPAGLFTLKSLSRLKAFPT